MSDWRPDPNQTFVPMSRRDLMEMLRLARTVRRFSRSAFYQEAIRPVTPESARVDPGHEAVMMGYDFHLTPNGPRLIEVNTNAGGGLMAYRAWQPCFPPGPCFPDAIYDPRERGQARLLQTFAREFALFTGGSASRPGLLVILDEAPEKQFLYPEMRAFATLLTQWGSETLIAAPEALEMGPRGVFHQGRRVEMIYNRHCDFYLESPQLAGLALAWSHRRVCLTPNPRQYGLLADKRRMILWSDPVFLRQAGLPDREIDLLTRIVPTTRFLASLDQEQVWASRNQWVFKPGVGFGSRGVLLGNKISRVRFNDLDPAITLAQRYIPPSQTVLGAQTMKTDIRLYCYRDQPLGVAARVYRGQVTNFQMPGNGFLPVRLIES
ncbi:MAG: hypothetical protein HQM02_02400 [Magnetococcales bacterium]|nr:hypothetical protein [Magnetococcales bacterium]